MRILDSGSARQVLRASGTYQMRILDSGSARQLLSIYPSPPPPSALSATLLRGIEEYVASGSARQVLRASATCRERMRLRASGTPRVSYLPREDVSGSARQVLRASGTYQMRILDSGSARQVLRASGTYQIRILDSGSARQLLSIYPSPPPPLGALGHSP